MKKDWKSQFKDWLIEICPWENIEKYVQFVGHVPQEWGTFSMGANLDNSIQVNKDTIRIRLFSKEYLYGITATKNYLGCISSCRKPRAGEHWTRGHDLPDGKFSRQTWEKIKNAIVRNEFVKVGKPIQSQADRFVTRDEMLKITRKGLDTGQLIVPTKAIRG